MPVLRNLIQHLKRFCFIIFMVRQTKSIFSVHLPTNFLFPPPSWCFGLVWTFWTLVVLRNKHVFNELIPTFYCITFCTDRVLLFLKFKSQTMWRLSEQFVQVTILGSFPSTMHFSASQIGCDIAGEVVSKKILHPPCPFLGSVPPYMMALKLLYQWTEVLAIAALSAW